MERAGEFSTRDLHRVWKSEFTPVGMHHYHMQSGGKGSVFIAHFRQQLHGGEGEVHIYSSGACGYFAEFSTVCLWKSGKIGGKLLRINLLTG